MKSRITVNELAALLECPAPRSDGQRVLSGVAPLETATPQDVAYLASDQYVKAFAATKAGVVIVQRKVKLPAGETRTPTLLVDDAELAIAKVLAAFAPPVPKPPVGIDAGARVAKSASVGESVAIGPNVFVGERVRIGARCVLHSGVYVGDDTVVGEDCVLFPNVVLRERITIGDRVTLNAGCVLGTDGFGYRWDGQKHAKIPQIGTIVIGDDVELGSLVCVDRAKFGVTRIGRGTKIDNLVQVAHNVEIGENCIIAGQSGLAGSAKLGRGVVFGGQVVVRDHVSVGDGAMAAATSGIAEDVPPKTIVSGTPALPHRQSLREQGAFRRLPELITQVRKLQEEIDALKAKLADATSNPP